MALSTASAGPRARDWSAPTFVSLEGGWLDPSNTGNRIREALDEIDFDWVTSHVWRKTVGTRA